MRKKRKTKVQRLNEEIKDLKARLIKVTEKADNAEDLRDAVLRYLGLDYYKIDDCWGALEDLQHRVSSLEEDFETLRDESS